MPREAIRASLTPFRRRLFAAAVLSNLPWAIASAVVVGALCRWTVVVATPWTTVFAWMGVLGGAAGLTLAVAQTPSVEQTARIVDARLGLQNRMTSALEFAGCDDAMSRLVVHDAVDHLSTRRPGEIPATGARSRAGIAALAAACCLALGLAVLDPRVSAAGGVGSSRDSIGDGAMASDRAGSAPRATARTGAMQTGTAAGSPAPSEAAVPGGQTPPADRRPPATAQPQDGRTGGVPQEASGSTPGSMQPGPPGSQGRTTTEDAAGTGRGDARAGAAAAMPQTSGQSASGSPRASADRTAGAGATGASPDAATLGGGVAGGTLRSGEPRPASDSAPAVTFDSGTVAAASARAETAIARARVPHRLRGYVRDYFRVLRGDTTP